MKKICVLMFTFVIMAFWVCGSVHAFPFSGLVGAWTFDDGTANDSSGSGNHGIVNGATTTTDRNGNAGQAYHFDGSNDFIGIASTTNIPSGNSNYTVSLWANVEGLPNWGGGYNGFIFSRGGESALLAQHIALRYGEIALTHYTQDNMTSYTPPINEWFNLLVTFNGSNEKLYIDGNLEWTSPNFTLNVNNSSSIKLGRHVNVSSYFFNGMLDDVLMYDRVLSSNEIQELASPVPEPATIALLGIGLAGLAGGAARRKWKKRAVVKS